MSVAIFIVSAAVGGGVVGWSACAGWKSRRPRGVISAGILEPPPSKRPKFESLRVAK
jgi:hypothetical protein